MPYGDLDALLDGWTAHWPE